MVLLGIVAGADQTRPGAQQPVLSGEVPFERKMAWILSLEDRRILDDLSLLLPAGPEQAGQGRGRAGRDRRQAGAAVTPDLIAMLGDGEARVRRRAALAIGRVGLARPVPQLTRLLLSRDDPEVRQMAAFALGLIGDLAPAASLRAALADSSPLVQGRAAEALGTIGDRESAPAIAAMAAARMKDGEVLGLDPDEMASPLKPEVEAFRLAIYALTRLKAWDALASVVLAPGGNGPEPRLRWWPVAYALSRIEDPRAAPALLTLARTGGSYTKAFAARGLGALKHAPAVPLLTLMAESGDRDPRPAVMAVRALAQIGSGDALPVLRMLAATRAVDPNLRLEVVAALGALRDRESYDVLLDLLADLWPAMRVAALRAVHAIDPDGFPLVLSGLTPDPHPSVRAAIASLVARMDPGIAGPRLLGMLTDTDTRVRPAVIQALSAIKAPGLDRTLLDLLKDPDVMVRAAAATAIGERKIPGAEAALFEAYKTGAGDGAYAARAAALAALSQYGAAVAFPALTQGLADQDWAVRVRAAGLLKGLDASIDVEAAIRPAPSRPTDYGMASLAVPAVSPHVFLETDKGTIELELAVLDAPQTCANFVRLARDGYFSGLAIHRVVPNFVVQDGDPRGDGEGGPGYTLRDEINQRPYLRGTLGMALDWADTGGSQWFITHSPQPHLDGRYTVFGHVVTGMEVVDRLQQWDVIRQVRIWDGVAMVTR
ncbi:MAG: HEAT repeat domain-containing protein [Acidobacteriota bacterium]